MAETAIDKSYETFQSGDIVAYKSFGDVYGVQIIKRVYVDELGEYRFIGASGRVTGSKFVIDKDSNGNPRSMTLWSTKELRSEYTIKWTPGMDVKKGDILVDQNGEGYVVSSSTQVWSIKSGTYATTSYWAEKGKELKHASTAGNNKLSDEVGKLW